MNNCNDNKNNGCNCQCNTNKSDSKTGDKQMDMTVCTHVQAVLPMLQTYNTKVLKPNLCCKKNILTQEMIACEDMKYVIKWDFDLNGKTITVPNNCILEFDGGTLKNGTIIGQDTFIDDAGGLGTSTIFGEGITREGTWRQHEGGGGSVEQIQSDWNQTDSNKPDFIKNKPEIPSGVVIEYATADDIRALFHD